jgi:hypothetical protein
MLSRVSQTPRGRAGDSSREGIIARIFVEASYPARGDGGRLGNYSVESAGVRRLVPQVAAYERRGKNADVLVRFAPTRRFRGWWNIVLSLHARLRFAVTYTGGSYGTNSYCRHSLSALWRRWLLGISSLAVAELSHHVRLAVAFNPFASQRAVDARARAARIARQPQKAAHAPCHGWQL